MNYELITYNLKEKARQKDMNDFKKYVNGEYTIQDLKYRWTKNNKVAFKDYELISDELFESWINSLGWYKEV